MPYRLFKHKAVTGLRPANYRQKKKAKIVLKRIMAYSLCQCTGCYMSIVKKGFNNVDINQVKVIIKKLDNLRLTVGH